MAVFGYGAHDLFRGARRNVRLDVQRDFDAGADDACKVGNHFFGDLSGVPPHPVGVQLHGAVVASGARIGRRPLWRESISFFSCSRVAVCFCWPRGRLRRFFLFQLPQGDLRLHEEAAASFRYGDMLARAKSLVAPGFLVVALRDGEGVLHPGKAARPPSYRFQQHRNVMQPGQINILREILRKLPGLDMVPPPQGHFVHMLAQNGGAQRAHQHIFAYEPLVCPLRQPGGALQRQGLPFDRRVGGVLRGDQQPLPRFGQLHAYAFVVGRFLGFGLLRLARVQIEFLPFVQDGFPGKIPADGAVDILKAHPVCGKKDECIPVKPGGVAPHFEEGAGLPYRLAFGRFVVWIFCGQHDQAARRVFRYVRWRARQGVYARKSPLVSQCAAQAFFQLGVDLVRVALQFGGAVLRQFGHRRLGRIPYPRTVLIQVCGFFRKMAQGVPENGGRFSGRHAAKFDPAVFEPSLRRMRYGSRPEENRAGHAPRSVQFAEVRVVGVDPERQRIRSVYIRFDDRNPVVRQVAGQFGAYAKVAHRNHGRQNKRVPVSRFPQRVDDRGHEAQDPAGTLEFEQGGPVAVEPVENFGVDGVRGLDTFFVLRVATFGRKFAALAAVQVCKGPRRYVPLLEGFRVAWRFEQAAAHDLKTFFGAGRAPYRRHAAYGAAQSVQRRSAPHPAHLDVVRLGVGRTSRVRRREGYDKQATVREFGGFRKRLRKRELGFEIAAGQVVLVVELARIRDPFVDQHDAWAVCVEQFAEPIPGIGGVFVVGPDAFVGFLAAQLPGQFAPQRAHHGSVSFRVRVAGGYFVAYQHDALRFGQVREAGFSQQVVHAREFPGSRAGEQVVQRQHGVRFAAAEVGLELHHRIAVALRDALYGLRKQARQAFGKEGAAEEFLRVAVLVRAFAKMGLPQVGGEFRLLVSPARHILVRRYDFSPWLERSPGGGGFDQGAPRLAFFGAHLFVVDRAPQFFLHALDFVRLLRGGDGGEEPDRRIQHAIRIVAGERPLMRPSVAPFEQLRNHASFGMAQRHAKHFPPGRHHQFQERRDVPFADGPVRKIPVPRKAFEIFRGDGLAFFAKKFARHIGGESLPKQFHRLVYSFTVRNGHIFGEMISIKCFSLRDRYMERGARMFGWRICRNRRFSG